MSKFDNDGNLSDFTDDEKEVVPNDDNYDNILIIDNNNDDVSLVLSSTVNSLQPFGISQLTDASVQSNMYNDNLNLLSK